MTGSFNAWIDIGIPAFMLVLGGLISWRVSIVVFKKQYKTDADKVINQEIYTPLATGLADTIRKLKNMGEVFSLHFGGDIKNTVLNCLDIDYLNEYIEEPVKYKTPIRIQKDIKDILELAEGYMKSYDGCTKVAREIVNIGLDEAIDRANEYLFIGANNTVKINLHCTHPSIYLQRYLQNDFNAGVFFSSINAKCESITSGNISIELDSRDRYPVGIAPNNVTSLIETEERYLNKIGQTPSAIKERLWKLYVMKEIYDEEKQITERIRELPSKYSLEKKLNNILIKIKALKNYLDKEINKINTQFT